MRSVLFLLLFLQCCCMAPVQGQTARFDPLFLIGSGANNHVSAMASQTNGRVLLGGSFTSYQGVAAPRLMRIFPNGQRDSSFQAGAGADARINVMRVLPDGRILIGGLFFVYNNFQARGLARLNPNGAFDTTFQLGQGFGNEVLAIASMLDSGVLVSGFFSQFQQQVVTQPVKLLANGSRDLSFNVGGTGSVGLIEVMHTLPDGRILVAGSVTQYNGVPVGRVFRIFPNGQLDTSFQTGLGISGGNVRNLAVQPDGKIILVGSFTAYNGLPRNRLVRLHPNGSVDSSFVPNVNFTSPVLQLNLLPDGRILVFGNHTIPGQQLQHLAMIDSLGFFIAGGGTCTELNGGVVASALLPDSSIIIGGNFTSAGGLPVGRMAKVLTSVSVQPAGPPMVSATQTSICPGTSIFLSAAGALNGSQYWEWFDGGCNLNPVAIGGAFILVSPSITTTYFVRGGGNCLPNGPCDSITIYVDTLPPVPLVSSLLPITTLCGGNVPLPQAFDSCSGTITGVANRFLPITQPGAYTLVWSYTDNSGNVTQQTQQLLVDTLDTRVTQQNRQLTCLNTTAALQWMQCDQQYAVQTGFTAAVFEPFISGQYAVEVRQNGCVDTSLCFAVVVGSVPELPQGWLLYPNPADRWLFTKLPTQSKLRLYDLQGRQLTQWYIEDEQAALALPDLPAGLYLISIEFEGILYRHRLQIHQF